METRRLILAVSLSIVVIVLYQYFFMPKPLPVSRPEVQAEQPREAAPADTNRQQPVDLESLLGAKREEEPQTAENLEISARRGQEERTITVENDLYQAVFTSRGAALLSFVLKKYRDDEGQPLDLVSQKADRFGFLPFHFSPFGGDETAILLNKELFSIEANDFLSVDRETPVSIVFEYGDPDLMLQASKRFTFNPSSYVIDIDCRVFKNGRQHDLALLFGPDLENNISSDRKALYGLKAAYWDGQNLESLDLSKVKAQPSDSPLIEKLLNVRLGGSMHWVSLKTTYFAVMFKTDWNHSQFSYSLIREKREGNEVESYYYTAVSNARAVFLGPQDETVLADIKHIFPEAHKVIEYGWFGSLARLMLKGILLIYSFVPNYGWALIIFTIFLKILLFPLTYSSSVSMAKMQTLQPKMKAIKKKYKNTRDVEQKRQMNAELMALYKEEKVNPAGGCLPILIQLPVLWGFFRLLSVSINVRHEPWTLWISDLSQKDPFYVLPILMGLTQILLMKMSPSGGDDIQKKIMYVMPVLMVILFMSFPSGLNLYWFVSNLLQIGQQHIINKTIFKKKKEEEKEMKMLRRKKGVKAK